MRLSEVADAVGINAAHLARVFRTHHGVSVGEFGRRLRLDRAAAEMARNERLIAEIAAEAGFADQSHFTRLCPARGLTEPRVGLFYPALPGERFAPGGRGL